MRSSLGIALLLLSSAGFGRAQNRANFPWWNSPVVSEIGLSPMQRDRIRQIVRSYRDRLFDARNNVQKAEAALDDVVNDPEVNPEGARRVIDRVANARAASSRVFLQMSVEVRSVLTLAQWRQLVRRWDEVKKNRSPETTVPQP